MELIKWANGKGQTLEIAKEDFDAIRQAIVDAYYKGKSNVYTGNDGQMFEVVTEQ